MLDTLRNSARGTAGKVIVTLIVLTFVLFGAQSIVSIAVNRAPATVNGEDISAADLQNSLNTRQQELTSQYGAELAAQRAGSGMLQNEVLESLISQKVQSQLATRLHFDVSDDQILKTIADVPVFQKDGKFDQDTYKSLLAANGLTHQEFIEAQKEQTEMAQMRTGIIDSAFVVNKVAQAYAQLEAQARTVQYKEFDSTDYLSSVSLNDQEIADYYNENESDYMSKEQIKVNYLVVTLASLAASQTVSDEEIQSAYDSYVKKVAEEETREISHILFAHGDEEAEAKAALARLKAGEKFSDLARELSDDPGSAEFGGSLGVLSPGVFVPEFYDAAMALDEAGQVSEPIKTKYGVHLIRLDSIDKKTPETLAQKRASLVAEIKEKKAKDELTSVKTQLADEAFSADDLAAVAKSFNVPVEQSDWFTKGGGQGYFAEANVSAAAFTDQVKLEGVISDVVETQDDSLIAMQKADYKPEAQQPLEQVKDSVVTSLTKQKAEQLMAEALKKQLAEKTVSGEGWSEAVSIRRDDSDVPKAVRDLAFTMPKPTAGESSFAETNGIDVAYLVAVESVNDGTVDKTETDSSNAFVKQTAGAYQYQMLYNIEREAADVKVRN